MSSVSSVIASNKMIRGESSLSTAWEDDKRSPIDGQLFFVTSYR
jgi:hypothetical protein